MWLLGFLTLRWVIQVDPFHPDKWTEYASILLLLFFFFLIGGYLGSSCFQDTWSRVASLPKQQNANDLISQSVEAINC